MLSVMFVAVGGTVRNLRHKIRADKRMKTSLGFMLSAVFLIFSDMLASGRAISLNYVAVDLFPSALALWMLSSTMAGLKFTRRLIDALLFCNLCIFVFHLCRVFMVCKSIPPDLPVGLVSVMAVLLVLFFMSGLFFRMRNVRTLMKNGTVWSFVCISVDVVYFCFMIIGTAFLQVGFEEVSVLLVDGVVAATGMRILADSKFLIWQEQETLIAESMNLMTASSVVGTARVEDVYKELYDRIVVYFEQKKPYLDSELTINDIVKDLYSNKLYISKAISHFTGRNFCQFVNYYRVVHSMELFRKNPEMRIHELATMNGFNTVVSYSMAFRLFIGETPSEWCRKEKSRLMKKGKLLSLQDNNAKS